MGRDPLPQPEAVLCLRAHLLGGDGSAFKRVGVNSAICIRCDHNKDHFPYKPRDLLLVPHRQVATTNPLPCPPPPPAPPPVNLT